MAGPGTPLVAAAVIAKAASGDAAPTFAETASGSQTPVLAVAVAGPGTSAVADEGDGDTDSDGPPPPQPLPLRRPPMPTRATPRCHDVASAEDIERHWKTMRMAARGRDLIRRSRIPRLTVRPSFVSRSLEDVFHLSRDCLVIVRLLGTLESTLCLLNLRCSCRWFRWLCRVLGFAFAQLYFPF